MSGSVFVLAVGLVVLGVASWFHGALSVSPRSSLGLTALAVGVPLCGYSLLLMH